MSVRLIIFFSKSLLRHPLVKSDLKDMAPGSTFQRYIPDPHPENLDAPEDIKRHIVRSGAYRELTHTDTGLQYSCAADRSTTLSWRSESNAD
jgi:2-oxoglutarate dehydrogenase E1 component